MFGEPPRSQYDLHFTIFGFPVRIHPWFWVIGLLLGLGGGGKLLYVFIWIAALFLGILVHELGHAFAMRSCGLRPWITLYGMGGLASYDTSQLMQSSASDWKKQIFISFAGPGAGFLLATFFLVLARVTGHEVTLDIGTEYYLFLDFRIGHFASLELWLFVNYIVFISLTWGLVNLLPIYPLDGGHISRDVLLRIDRPSGVRCSLVLSMLTAGSLAVYLLYKEVEFARLAAENGDKGNAISLFPIIFFGYLCYSSWSMLQMISGGGRRW